MPTFGLTKAQWEARFHTKAGAACPHGDLKARFPNRVQVVGALDHDLT
jgi:hypothetical protein